MVLAALLELAAAKADLRSVSASATGIYSGFGFQYKTDIVSVPDSLLHGLQNPPFVHRVAAGRILR
jgi:hypothetical protein